MIMKKRWAGLILMNNNWENEDDHPNKIFRSIVEVNEHHKLKYETP